MEGTLELLATKRNTSKSALIPRAARKGKEDEAV